MKKKIPNLAPPLNSPFGTADISRRNFLSLAGLTTATIALRRDAFSQLPCSESIPEPLTLDFDEAQLAGTHDLVSLPSWGPYSKKFHGISHIPDVHRGLSFDLSIFPTPIQGPVTLPSVTDRSSVHPWEAAPDLSFYTFRIENIWKDKMYCELSFSSLSDHSRHIQMELINQTESRQELVLNCLAQLCLPPLQENTAEPIQMCHVELPTGSIWVHALDYTDLTFAKPRPSDNLVPDGRFRGEARHHNCVGGSAIADRFGHDAGDSLHYHLRLDHTFTNAVLVWRYQLDHGQTARFQMDGTTSHEVLFEGTGDFSIVAIPLGQLTAGDHDLSFVSQGAASAILNGFVLVEASQANAIQFVQKRWDQTPQFEAIGRSDILIKYPELSNCYGVSLDVSFDITQILKWRDLDATFHNKSSDYTHSRIYGKGKDHAGDPDSLFLHMTAHPIVLQPNSRRIVRGIVCTGTESEVRHQLASFNPKSIKNQRLLRSAREKSLKIASLPAGESYLFSQQRMAAVTLMNLVYPQRIQGNYIRHYSPGKIWDCLYTWDSGFIGLGLLELDPKLALEILNAYTTPEDAQSAFIHHGTPLATQIYLYSELWNRTQSKEMLAYLYPRLRQFYRFLAGRYGSSTTRRHKDRLIVTWDYFYNSGGWDDYPPQKYVHQQNLVSSATPAVSSSHVIRCAKLLRQAAEELGKIQDIAEYDRDIAELAGALQKYSWDSTSGYFGYIMHDKQGNPSGILRTADEVNFNMGLDGVTPLIAGICTSDQVQQILQNLFSTNHMWTDVGITSVDQSAPYYRTDGYWNGSVWLAHQWFLWKSMLDLGRGDLAIHIAQTGLNLWKTTTDSTYNCLEHFYPKSPYGAGWSQFSSLSSPALLWFAALYTPGRFTCGFDVWIQSCEFRFNNRELRAKLKASASNHNRTFSVLACMHQDSKYKVLWNGTPIAHTAVNGSLLHIQLPSNIPSGELSILLA